MGELSHPLDQASVPGGLLKVFPILAHANAANFITSASIAIGVGSSLLVVEQHLLAAFLLAPLTIVCDTLDGLVARRMGTSSPFGAQLDSFADALSFGVLPAMLGYGLGMRGPLTMLLVWYVLGTVWRLARFGQVGLRTNAAGRECFEGVPTSLTAAMFYLVAPVVLRLPTVPGLALLSILFLVSVPLLNSSLLIPKRSLFTRAMWVLVPVSTVVSCLLLR